MVEKKNSENVRELEEMGMGETNSSTSPIQSNFICDTTEVKTGT